MRSTLPSFVVATLCFLILIGGTPEGQGQVTPSQLRHFSLSPPADTSLGEVVVASRTHVVAGNPKSGPPTPVAISEVGSISIFNASTGQRIRQVFAPVLRANGKFGAALALHGNVLAVGEPGDASVHLYDVVSGRLLRTIPGAAGSRFGEALAMHGDRLAVGAPEENGGRGAVFVFNVRNGEQLNGAPILHPSPNANDNFGAAVALSGDWLMVGAPRDNTVRGTDAGSAFVFELDQFNRVFTFDGTGLTGDPLDANDNLGTSVAIHGPVFIAGAPFDESGGPPLSGSVLVFFAQDDEFVVLRAAAPTSQGFFGFSMAFADGLLAVGEPGATNTETGSPVLRSGKAHVFSLMDSLSPARVATLEIRRGPETADGDELGTSVAVCGNRVYAATEVDNDGDSPGAVIRFDPISRQPDSQGNAPVLLQRGDSVAAIPGAVFSGIDDIITGGGTADIHALATHAGPGSRGRKKGLYLGGGTPLLQVGDTDLLGVTITDILSQQLTSRAQFLGRRRGTGITGANSLAIFQLDVAPGFDPKAVFALGEDPGFGVGAKTKRFGPIVQDFDGFAIVQGKLVVDRNVVTPISDSFVAARQVDAGGAPLPAREGSVLGGEVLGEILPRLVTQFSQTVVASMLANPPATNQGVFLLDENVRLARKGDEVSGGASSSVFYRSFLGESGNGSDNVVIRAAVTGPGVNGRNNEGLWLKNTNFANPLLLVRKGDQAIGAPAGVVYDRFLAFRCLNSFGGVNGVVVLAKLRGPGVNARNDLAVYHVTESVLPVPIVNLLLREGDPAPTATRATIGTIQRFAVGDDGTFAVLISLVNRAGEATPADNQALAIGFPGFDVDPNHDDSFQRPVITLRKGWNFNQGGSETIRSFSLSNRLGNATGALGIGVGEVVDYGGGGTVISTLEFEDRQRVSFRFAFGFED